MNDLITGIRWGRVTDEIAPFQGSPLRFPILLPSPASLVVVAYLFPQVGWICFVTGFGLEATNPDRLSSLGWDEGVERFSWYATSQSLINSPYTRYSLCVAGGIALVSFLAFLLTRDRLATHFAVAFGAIALFFVCQLALIIL